MSGQKIFSPEDFEKPKPPKPSKVPKMALGIVIVALLGVGGCFLLKGKDTASPEQQASVQVITAKTDSVSVGVDSTTAVQDDDPDSASSDETKGSQDSKTATGKNQVASSEPTAKPDQSPFQKSTVAIYGTVEEKARQVIRGNYGNGQVRKDKLGAEYRTIQDKVNEMYRQGLVH